MARKMQHIADGESVVQPHEMPQHNVCVSEMFMLIGHVHNDTPPPFCPTKHIVHRTLVEAQAGGDSLQDYPGR